MLARNAARVTPNTSNPFGCSCRPRCLLNGGRPRSPPLLLVHGLCIRVRRMEDDRILRVKRGPDAKSTGDGTRKRRQVGRLPSMVIIIPRFTPNCPPQ